MRERETVARALAFFGAENIDFADALIAATALVDGPPAVCTFDRDFRRIPGLTLLGLADVEAEPRGQGGPTG